MKLVSATLVLVTEMPLFLPQVLSLWTLYLWGISKDPVDAEGYHVGFEWLAVGKDVYFWVSVCEQGVTAPTIDNGVNIAGRA